MNAIRKTIIWGGLHSLHLYLSGVYLISAASAVISKKVPIIYGYPLLGLAFLYFVYLLSLQFTPFVRYDDKAIYIKIKSPFSKSYCVEMPWDRIKCYKKSALNGGIILKTEDSFMGIDGNRLSAVSDLNPLITLLEDRGIFPDA